MRRAGLVLLLLAVGGWEALRTADPDVEKGNRAFEEGRYADALAHYRSAEERGADARLHFDMGAALYKMAEKSNDENGKARLFERAEDEFRRAADTDDVRLKSSAYYNLGNSLYQRKQWEDAISAYKRALRADPQSEAARNNLEMALRQRKKQERQGKPDQGQKKGQGQKQDPKQDRQSPQGDEDRKDQKEGQPGETDRKDRDGQAGQDNDKKEEEEKRRGREEERTQAPDREPPPDPGASMSDTPSDQERKLDELERRSRDLRKRLLRQSGRNRGQTRLPSRKDW